MNIQRWAYLGLGVFMLVLGIFFYLNSNQFRNNAETATSTVVDFVVQTDTSCPLLRFTTKAGESVDAVSDVCNNNMQIGDTVELFYDPDQPDRIQVNNSAQSLWIPAFFVVFGLYALAQGSGILGRKNNS